jgi:hypothetical protein
MCTSNRVLLIDFWSSDKQINGYLYLQAANTVEEKILAVQDSKRRAVNAGAYTEPAEGEDGALLQQQELDPRTLIRFVADL